jgi:predicted transcriptional regulator
MRRRKVITHIVASRPLSLADAASLTYRDPRALIRTIPTADVVGHLPECAHGRTLAALGALEHSELAHLEAGVVQRTEPAGTADPSSPRGR